RARNGSASASMSSGERSDLSISQEDGADPANPETFINAPPLHLIRGCFICFLGQPEAEPWIPLRGKSSPAPVWKLGCPNRPPLRSEWGRKTPSSSEF